MSKSSIVTTEGADIVYDLEGSGPLILLVAGGNGDSSMFTGLSAHLATRYTVAKYDRRADARSGGDPTGQLDMAQAARDAAAVIRAVDQGPAYVFGNSAGANIALKLTADHPRLVRGLIDHEPPITDFLPEPEAGIWRTFFDRVYDLYLEEGTGPAMRLFASSMVGFGNNEAAPGDQAGGNHDRFLAYEFRNVNHYVPDVEALRSGGVPIIMAVGRESGDAFYVLTARELARQLPCPLHHIIGNHLGYRIHAREFAEELHHLIGRLES